MTDQHYLEAELDRLIQSDPSIFQFLQQGSLDGLWYWDLEKPKNEWMSPRFWELLGFDPATREHSPDEWQDLIHPDDLAVALKNFERHCADPSHPYDQVVRYRHADGSTVWVRCRGVAIRDDDGRCVRMLGAHNEITQLKQAERSLERARDDLAQKVAERTAELKATNEQLYRQIYEREKAEEERRGLEAKIHHTQKLESLGVLAGGIAHDFNNLLMGIVGHAGLAMMKASPHSPLTPHLEQIEQAAQRAGELTNQMLAYSGRGRFVVQPVSLSAAVEEIGHLLQAVISKKASLKFDFADDLPRVEGDATQIRQVVMNLITNASDALGEETGIITVTTGTVDADAAYLAAAFGDWNLEEGRYAFLEVSDTGAGMDAETRSQIFDPFFSTKVKGRGLGLAATLGIMRGHRGALRVYSEPGKGSTFKLLFPAARQPREVRIVQPLPADDWRGEGLVLVADDEEVVRETVRQIVEQAGFQAILTADGRECVERFRERVDEVSLVLLDMTMPRLGGDEAFAELRRIRPDVRVVLTSGYNQQDATSAFAGKGLAGFLQKPFKPRELLDMMRGLLDAEGDSA